MKSRPRRWREAINRATDALEKIRGGNKESGCLLALDDALSDLEHIREEYENWLDNLPENLYGSPVGEKLEEVTALDFSIDVLQINDTLDEKEIEEILEEVDDVLQEADLLDLPRGFGRD